MKGMKKKFRFKLQTVENLRKREEDFALKGLADSQKRFQALVDKKSALFRELETNLRRREDLSGSSQIIHSFQLHNDYIIGCKVRIFQTDQLIFKARKQVEKALREYLNAKRKTRALELLREKAFLEFKKELRVKEQKELEDLYTMRANRMRNGDDLFSDSVDDTEERIA
jgi:flagellar protein FliJ